MAPSKSRTGVAKILHSDQQAEAYESNHWPQASREQGLRKSLIVTNRLKPMGEINGLKQIANRGSSRMEDLLFGVGEGSNVKKRIKPLSMSNPNIVVNMRRVTQGCL